MNRTIVFDMDGTIADFYGVENWLIEIRNESTRPYELAKPLYNIETLNTILEFLKMSGWRIVVTSWLAKDSTKEYKEKVRKAKLEWLKKYSFPYDEIHLVKYGTTKANCTRKLGGFQILVDDNEKVRKGWNLGATINANEDIIEKLKELL
jgi:FMN phosphatase YigB (HAD superfamily)